MIWENNGCGIVKWICIRCHTCGLLFTIYKALSETLSQVILLRIGKRRYYHFDFQMRKQDQRVSKALNKWQSWVSNRHSQLSPKGSPIQRNVNDFWHWKYGLKSCIICQVAGISDLQVTWSYKLGITGSTSYRNMSIGWDTVSLAHSSCSINPNALLSGTVKFCTLQV